MQRSHLGCRARDGRRKGSEVERWIYLHVHARLNLQKSKQNDLTNVFCFLKRKVRSSGEYHTPRIVFSKKDNPVRGTWCAESILLVLRVCVLPEGTLLIIINGSFLYWVPPQPNEIRITVEITTGLNSRLGYIPLWVLPLPWWKAIPQRPQHSTTMSWSGPAKPVSHSCEVRLTCAKVRGPVQLLTNDLSLPKFFPGPKLAWPYANNNCSWNPEAHQTNNRSIFLIPSFSLLVFLLV